MKVFKNMRFAIKMNRPHTQMVSGICAFGLMIVSAMAAQAGPVEDVVECSGIVSDAERLACYDAGVTQLRASGLTSEQIKVTQPMMVQSGGGNQVQAAAQPTRDKERGLFGFGLPFGGTKRDTTPENFGEPASTAKSPAGQIARINDTVESVTYDYTGRFRVVLSNGQIWKQNNDKRMKIETGNVVEIRRGTVGGYLLRLDSKGKAVRVKRVK